MLCIYALLIFKYKEIFRHINEEIDKTILEKSVKQTEFIVKEKTLKNEIIVEYIFLEFINNLKYNMKFKNKEVIKEEKNNEDIVEVNKNEIKKESNLKVPNTVNDDKINTDEKASTNGKSTNELKETDVSGLFQIIKEMNKNNKEQNEKLKNLEGKINELKTDQEEKLNVLQTKISTMETQIEKITETLGNIQMRDKAKNLLRHYEYLLDNEDKDLIKKDKNEKWNLIVNKIKQNYRQICKFKKLQNIY